MRNKPLASPLLAAVLGTTAVLSAQAPAPAPSATSLAAGLAARFTPNQGQWRSPELYRVTTGGMHVFLEEHGWSFWLTEAQKRSAETAGASNGRSGAGPVFPPARRATAVRMVFRGAGQPTVRPESRLSGSSSFFLEPDPTRHRTGVPAFASVLYESMYDGVDVRVREGSGTLEYDVLLAPQADLGQVRIAVAGARKLRIEKGELVIDTDLGPVRQPRPATWTVGADGVKRTIACDYVLHGPNSFGFRAPERDPELALVVDPPIRYSTYVGGSGREIPYLIKKDGNGKILICGQTASMNFPTTNPLQATYGGGSWDGYIMRIDPTKPPATQVEFSTYLGGALSDRVCDIEARPGGLVAFVGVTESTGLPVTTGAFQAANAGAIDGFVGLLGPQGSTLLALSYLGGSADDVPQGISIDPAGKAVIAGETLSSDYPTTATAYDTTFQGATDAFVSVLPLTVTSLDYSTLLGGADRDRLYPSHTDANGVTTLIGTTTSADFPMTNTSFDPSYNGSADPFNGDALIVQFDPGAVGAAQLKYATFIGGSSTEFGYQVRVTAAGNLVASGTTASTDFPTTPDAYAPSFSGGGANNNTGDGFVIQIDPRIPGSPALLWGTYFGGPGEDQGLSCDVNSDGSVMFVGWTGVNGNVLLTTPGAARRFYWNNDGFLVHLSADGRQALYLSLLGGRGADGAWEMERISDGVAGIYGATTSSDLPTVNAFQSTYGGGNDGFVMLHAVERNGITRYGAPTRGSNGMPTIHPLADPVPGKANFGVGCSSAPVSKSGMLLLSAASLPGVPVLGIRLHVDLNPAVSLLVPVVSDAVGQNLLRAAYPTGGLGGPVYVQYAWFEKNAPLEISASDALRIN